MESSVAARGFLGQTKPGLKKHHWQEASRSFNDEIWNTSRYIGLDKEHPKRYFCITVHRYKLSSKLLRIRSHINKGYCDDALVIVNRYNRFKLSCKLRRTRSRVQTTYSRVRTTIINRYCHLKDMKIFLR